MDKLDQNIYDEIQGRYETKEEYENLYNRLFGIELSSTESRKRLSGLKDYLEYKMENQNTTLPSYKEVTEINKDGSQSSDKLIVINEKDKKDPRFLLEAHGFDSRFWELTNARNSIWNMSDKESDSGVKNLYSSKITVKPKILEFDLDWANDVFKNIKPLKKVNRVSNNNKKCLEIQLADIHIGLKGLSYEDELINMIDNIIDKNKHVDHFIIPLGQDFLNANHGNDSYVTTQKGTILEQTLSFEDMFKSGLKVASHLLDRIINDTNATVDCFLVVGNHDPQSCFGLFQCLIQRYRLNENIKFDDGIEERKYRLYGIMGLMYGHGQSEGKRIFGLFPTEAPEIFAKAEQREAHLTHLHRESAIDESGVLFRRMPTVNSADKYHKKMGYTNSTKRIMTFLYDIESGLESIDYFYLNK